MNSDRFGIIWIMKLTLLLLSFAGMMLAADAPPTEGTKAPDFKLNSQEGTPISLHDFRGKWVVLYFYPKDMTRGCTIEAHGFQRDQAQYDQKHAVVVGVSEDTVDSHKEFCAKDGLTFKLLADSNHEVAPLYGSMSDFNGMQVAQLNTFIVDPKGVIRKVFLKVNPTPHSQQVLEALTELQKTSE